MYDSLVGKRLLYFTSIFVSLGVFLFGYDQGVMSGIIPGPYFKSYFGNPSRAQIGTMVAILEIGALVSSLPVGHISDKYGRRRTVLWGASIFVAGGALQTCAVNLTMLIVGRVISGLGVGMLSTIVPVYQTEISPPHNRGKLACIEFTGNIVGYAASLWVDYACSFFESDTSWRLPLLIQCIIGLLLFTGSFLIVETPRWLLNKDHDEEGLTVLARLAGTNDVQNPRALLQFKEIKESIYMHRTEGKHSYLYMWRRYGKRVLIAMCSQAFAQLNGINIISYYAPLVFEQAGWTGRQVIQMAGINGIVYVLSTVPPWYLVDRWGRRAILISGGAVMCVSLLLISWSLYMDLSATPLLVVIFVIIYNAFHGYSWGPIPWLYPPEILPLSVRARGASLSTASNWAFNFLVGQVTPVLQDSMKWSMYLLPASSCVLSVLTVYFFFPETKGLTLEEMDVVFNDRLEDASISDVDTGRPTRSVVNRRDRRGREPLLSGA